MTRGAGRRVVGPWTPEPILPHPLRTLRSLPRSGLGLGLSFLALGLLLLLSVVFSVGQQDDDALLRHALEVEVDLGDLGVALFEAESGQRVYLLTGDDAILGPYRGASTRLDELLDRLDTAVGGDLAQAATFREIRDPTALKRAELARALSLRDAGLQVRSTAIACDLRRAMTIPRERCA